jgi:hypothetical protein
MKLIYLFIHPPTPPPPQSDLDSITEVNGISAAKKVLSFYPSSFTRFSFSFEKILGFVTIRNLTQCTINPSDCQQDEKSEKRCLFPLGRVKMRKSLPIAFGRARKKMRKRLPIAFDRGTNTKKAIHLNRNAKNATYRLR